MRGVDGPGMHILDVLPRAFPNAPGGCGQAAAGGRHGRVALLGRCSAPQRPWRAMSCHAMPCHAITVPRDAALCCAMPCPCCAMPCRVVQGLHRLLRLPCHELANPLRVYGPHDAP